MAFDVTALTDFIQENVELIIAKAVLGMNTAKWMTVVPGVKSATNLTEIDPDSTLQNGSCGWSPTGTTTLSPRTLTVKDIMNQEELCTKDLEKKFLQLEVAPGTIAGSESMPIEQIYIEQKVKLINKKIDVLMWQGDLASGDPDLNKMDGALKVLTADVPGGQQLTRTASVRDDVDEMLEELPEDVYGDDQLVIYMSHKNYRLLARELLDANLFHHNVQENAEFTMDYPGVNVKIVAITGLTGDNTLVLASMSNMYMGTDLESDFEEVDFFYDKGDRIWKFHMNWRQGFQVGFPEEVVLSA